MNSNLIFITNIPSEYLNEKGIVLQELINLYLTFNYKDLMFIINEDPDETHKNIARMIFNYNIKHKCFGCFYDKCDQRSHIEGSNGCLS